jgi:phenylacetic acid degradation operon negative regulatory protein
MDVTAKSLVLDLLSTMRSGSMPVSLLVRAGEAFGIDQNSVRVTVARLHARGLVERDERGHYRLGRGAASTMTRVAAWRSLGEATRKWAGGWVAVHTAAIPRSDRCALRRTRRALRLFSFEELSSGLLVRPDNLKPSLAELREELSELGLDSRAACFALSALDPVREQQARELWDLGALSRAYRDSLARLEQSRHRLGRLDESAAMVESFVVGGSVLRQLVQDPLLPDELLPGHERRALIEAMKEYDAIGRACWAPFMQRHGVAVRATPGRLGTVAAAQSPASAA